MTGASNHAPPPALWEPVSTPAVRIDLKQLARNLVAARSAAGVTQHQLARRSRVSRATIAQVEAGASDPRLSTLAMLAAALHVSPLVLLLGPRELRSLGQLARTDGAIATFATLRHATRLGPDGVADRAREILPSPAAAVGAAIGAAILPGTGSVTAAAWSYLIEQPVDTIAR